MTSEGGSTQARMKWQFGSLTLTMVLGALWGYSGISHVWANAQAPAPAPTSDAATTVPAFVAPVVASLLAFVAARMM